MAVNDGVRISNMFARQRKKDRIAAALWTKNNPPMLEYAGEIGEMCYGLWFEDDGSATILRKTPQGIYDPKRVAFRIPAQVVKFLQKGE